MRIEIFILLATAFFIYNSYHDGKYTKILLSYKKYYQMAFYVVLGLGVYLTLKRSPTQGKNMLVCANNVVKYMPIDKSSLEMLSPIFDLTGNNFMDEEPRFVTGGRGQNVMGGQISMGMGGGQEMSGPKKVNRSVSGMKKKYVASQQDWKCGECRKQLDYTYEVDHKIRLEHGGGNDVQNLIALCRECHGKKTVLETF
jgi:hypothetical protein